MLYRTVKLKVESRNQKSEIRGQRSEVSKDAGAGYRQIFRKPPYIVLPEMAGDWGQESGVRGKESGGRNQVAEVRGQEVGHLTPALSPERRGSVGSAIGRAMRVFDNDADMLGTSFYGYAKAVVTEVLSLGRCGTLVDWGAGLENRAYASLYRAEDILNWRVERIN